MLRRLGRRALALASVAAAVAAGTAAVLSALGAPSARVSPARAADAQLTSRSVAYGHARVVVEAHVNGRICFRVNRGTSTVARSCASSLAADEIRYASWQTAVGGIAGSRVRAVIVKLTKKGTVWATLRRGTFYAGVPSGHEPRAVVKVLAGGARRTFTVTGSR
ncbi:MAG TPA: hypothetical protein VFU56_02290 [Gaiellaceae bacterium]|nr:hypothetical protein [Gaiellaceae bacterium]